MVFGPKLPPDVVADANVGAKVGVALGTVAEEAAAADFVLLGAGGASKEIFVTVGEAAAPDVDVVGLP